ncbi:MAG: hypothetical protein H7340_08685 [Variovorax sp.]|nr:hypothetical protein [Variovorax sp.]
MIRRITNFASYEADRAAKVPRWQRVLWAALRIVLLALAVSLAGLFLFPTKPAHAEVQSHELTTLTFGPITALTL